MRASPPLELRDGHDAVTPAKLIEQVEIRRIETSNRLAGNAERRARLGQFFTPVAVARFMAAMFENTPRDRVRLLDPGGGSGVLTAAAVAQLCSRSPRPRKIEACIWEVDTQLAEDLMATVALCRAACRDAGIAFDVEVNPRNFIKDAASRIDSDLLNGAEFDWALINPPYRKLRGNTRERELLSAVGIETSNLYSAFVWLALEMLGEGGELVAITPRSYMNGPYFRPFRQHLLKTAAVRRVHVYEARDEAFGGDDVLQENAILHAVKGKATASVMITTSHGPDDPGMAMRYVPLEQLVLPDDPDTVLHVVPDEVEARISQLLRGLPATLDDLGVEVSTGRVVGFRARERLRAAPQPGDAPLIVPRHLSQGFVTWPQEMNGKPNAIEPEGPVDPLLLPKGWYVLVKRFSAKEERRRVVASLHDPKRVDAERVGFDNKLNVLHRRGAGLPPRLAKGLAMFLNSTLVDAYFRQFSGHTQVNAADLRSLKFPAAAVLERIGERINGRMPSEGEIDQLLRREVLDMSGGTDPVAAKHKVAEAREVLKAIKAPKGQRNERSAFTLLGLLDLEPGTTWSDASAPLRGVTELMDWMAQHYGKRYAPNTRETIRRFTLHQFIEMGLVLINPDEPGRPPNSPNNVYQVEPAALALLKARSTPEWEGRLAKYLESTEGTNRLRERARQMERVPVTLPSGTTLELSAGGQNVLIKEVVEAFAPRFTPGGQVVYVGDAGEKHLFNDTDYLSGLGVEIDPHGKMPDVVIHHVQRDWLVLVEAVTSHGPVNLLRHNQLKNLFAGSRAGLVLVTAFLDRRAMREYLPEIAWETEVWVADAPDHLIHFNGERFLGPYAE